ncbi:MAG: phosphate ABC transporter permease PstA [Actinomycetales bacterium]|nr:phosphate ABC transporter permease PstA [Actinomycetales bacterium]
MTTFEANSNLDLSPVARPANAEPWKRKDPKQVLGVAIAAILPALITWLVGTSVSADPTIAVVAVFLPLQLLAAGIMGVRIFGKRGIAESLLIVFTILLTILVGSLLLSVLWSVISAGAQTISWTFLSQNNVYISPTTSLEYGGVGHSIIGTLLIVGLTTLVTVPFGIAIAVYLTETRGKARGAIRILIQAMSGLPSVVAGLFVYSALIASGITQYAGWAGSLALLPLMLPTVARIAEEALRLVPADYRNGALALGAPAYRAFLQVTLPAAKTGIVTAVLLGIARIIGETAPLLLTTFAANNTSFNLFSGSMSSLPTYLYQYISNGNDTSTQRAWGAALVVLILVGVLFTTARILGRSKKTTSKALTKATNARKAK